jgi:hypothetical protein
MRQRQRRRRPVRVGPASESLNLSDFPPSRCTAASRINAFAGHGRLRAAPVRRLPAVETYRRNSAGPAMFSQHGCQPASLAVSRAAAQRNRYVLMRRRCPARGAEPFPGFIDPSNSMLREEAPSGERWVHEIKFDGDRAQAHLQQGFAKTCQNGSWTFFRPKAPLAAPHQPGQPDVRLPPHSRHRGARSRVPPVAISRPR